MNVIITSMNGNTHRLNLNNKESVYMFIDQYKNKLNKNQRVKVTCDILGIDGYIQGKSN